MPPSILLRHVLFSGMPLPHAPDDVAPDAPAAVRPYNLDLLVPPDLHARIKAAAAAAGMPMSAWLAARLRDRLAPAFGGSSPAKALQRDHAAARRRAARRQEP